MGKVVIIDYGMGNLYSVKSAISFIGFDSIITDDKSYIKNADYIILPGVGEFNTGIKNLHNSGIFNLLLEISNNKSTRILGICLGMQLMALTSDEGGLNKGLGLIKGHVRKFNCSKNLRVPHVGFNDVKIEKDSILGSWTNGIPKDFYFVHSHRIVEYEVDLNTKLGVCNYGGNFMACYERGNIFATQFHPEKSQTNGLNVIYSFLNK